MCHVSSVTATGLEEADMSAAQVNERSTLEQPSPCGSEERVESARGLKKHPTAQIRSRRREVPNGVWRFREVRGGASGGGVGGKLLGTTRGMDICGG
ncbi:hypothetical protein PIB30_044466 [Stylosanthes scabra]|uniref:Uncharacterized protein n=1 Tax=Stylosanthes scabra TaxID=79078 RepID=A0ABU6UJ45_9FABA|nr:hypothetical protein [Stylosanthes scabra]